MMDITPESWIKHGIGEAPTPFVERGLSVSRAGGCSVTTDELRDIAASERWKADNGPAESRDGFIARAEVIEQLADEIESQNKV